MDKTKNIILELVLIFASVLVFRSLWTLMDKVPALSTTRAHIIFLSAGIILTVYAFELLIKKKK